MGCVLGQHDEIGKKKRAIYYLSKKFTKYESRYLSVEKICYALAWIVKRLRQYMLCHTTWLITKLDPIKYIFEKPSLLGRIARWQVLLSGKLKMKWMESHGIMTFDIILKDSNIRSMRPRMIKEF